MAVEEVWFKLPRSASLYCPENKGFAKVLKRISIHARDS